MPGCAHCLVLVFITEDGSNVNDLPFAYLTACCDRLVTMSVQGDGPPAPNPFLSAYESFKQNTPYLTRTILSIQAVSYLASWFINPHYALANIPQFAVFQFEIYRVVLSPLVNTTLISLIFAFLSFTEMGKRLEYSMGTVAFGWFCLGVAMISNLGFLAVSLLLYMVSGGEQGYLLSSASGIWLILFGAIAAGMLFAATSRAGE
jgi:membrane associated rhomboid family serine protease